MRQKKVGQRIIGAKNNWGKEKKWSKQKSEGVNSGARKVRREKVGVRKKWGHKVGQREKEGGQEKCGKKKWGVKSKARKSGAQRGE